MLENEIWPDDNRSVVGGYCFPVGAIGGYCFRVGVYCEWVGAIVLFVYSIICDRMGYCL